MRGKPFLKKLVSIGVAVCMAATLSGCFDLGEFSNDSAYYAAFADEVGLVYQTPNQAPDKKKREIQRDYYSLRDYFYNKNTVEKFAYGDPEDDEDDTGKNIPKLPYIYMVIPVEQDLNMESLALYFNATKTEEETGTEDQTATQAETETDEETGTAQPVLDISFYVVDDLPDGGSFTNIELLGDPEYQQKPDENANVVTSDPKESEKIGETQVRVENGSWFSMSMSWKGENVVRIKENQYILLRFMNNRKVNSEENVAFCVTNLLIRAVA